MMRHWVTRLCATCSDQNESVLRDRVLVQYENKIRNFSTTDKRFAYFKSDSDGMNAQDLALSVAHSALRHLSNNCANDWGRNGKLSLFVKKGKLLFDGFVVCLAFLGVAGNTRAAFQWMDSDRSGLVEIGELQKLIQLEGKRAGLPIRCELDLDLARNLFGEDLNGAISFKVFDEFINGLMEDVLELEFNLCARDSGMTIQQVYERICGNLKDSGECLEFLEEKAVAQEIIQLDDWIDLNKKINALSDCSDIVKSLLVQEDGMLLLSDWQRLLDSVGGLDSRLGAALFLCAGAEQIESDSETKEWAVDWETLYGILKARSKRLFSSHTEKALWKCAKQCFFQSFGN